MATNGLGQIDRVYQLARTIHDQLEPLAASAGSTNALNLRLALAHSLGLLDQLSEILHDDDSMPSSQCENVRRVVVSVDEETLSPIG